MAHNFNTIEGTEVFNVNDAVQGSHALTLDDVKNFVGADKFHSNIVGTAPYDPLNPLAGWVAPSLPIAGNTVKVKFTDGTVANYTYDGTVWGLDFVESSTPINVYNGLSEGSIRWGQEIGLSGDPAKLVFDTEIPMYNKSVYWRNNGIDGHRIDGGLDGYTKLFQPKTNTGGAFLQHKPNTDVGNPPKFTLGLGATSPSGFNYENYSDYVFSLGLNIPDASINDDILTYRGGISMNIESFYDALVNGDGSQEFHLVHYAVPNSPTSALRFMTSRIFEDRSKGGNLGFSIGTNTDSNAFYVTNQNNVEKFKLDWLNNDLTLLNNMNIYVQTNNIDAIRQLRNGSVSSVGLIGLDDQNRTHIHDKNFYFENGNIMHTDGNGFQLGSNTDPIFQGPLFISSAQTDLLRLRRSDLVDEYRFTAGSNYFAYNYQSRNILRIDNGAPNNMFCIASDRAAIGSYPAFGKFGVTGQQSGISLSLLGITGGDAIYMNGGGASDINIMRMDLGATNLLRLPLYNNSLATNAGLELNLATASTTGANFISFGDNSSGNGWQVGCDRASTDNLKFLSASSKLTGGVSALELLKNGGVLLKGIKTAADDASAGGVGCIQGEVYKTATGELRIKL